MTMSREQRREYMRDYRRRKALERAQESGAVASVTDLPAANPSETVFDAVARELTELRSAIDQPGVAASCVALARVLDDPSAKPQHPAAARTLGDLLARLRAAEIADEDRATSTLALLRRDALGRRRRPSHA